jgi:hypothetical protein
VTHTSSRKYFFAKLLGVVAAASALPKLFAQTRSPAPSASTAAKSSGAAFQIRHDARAVSRRDVA